MYWDPQSMCAHELAQDPSYLHADSENCSDHADL